MKHLDDGSLHAWLDRDRSGMDPERSTEIERHLRECEVCAARLRDAEALTGRAASILGSVNPEGGEIPPFAEVLDRAGLSVPDRSRFRPGRRWLPLAWAASVAGAVGLGWWTNDLMRVEQVAFRTQPVEVANESIGEPLEERPEIEATAGGAALREEVASPTESPGSLQESPGAESFADAAAPPAERERDLATARTDPTESFGAAAGRREVTLELDEVIEVEDPVTGPDAWVPVSPEEAEATVGFTPLVVPGWEVVSVELAEEAGASAVRIVQTDERGSVLTVVQHRGAVGMLDQLESSESTTVTISRDGLVLTGTAPVGADSLSILLEQAR